MTAPQTPHKIDEKNSDEKTATNAAIGQIIGSRLKALYEEFSDDEVPDKINSIIGQLEKEEDATKTP